MKVNWKTKLEKVVEKYDEVFFYSADPGATAVLEPIQILVEEMGKAGYWFVEGWAAEKLLPNALKMVHCDVHKKLVPDCCSRAIIMGQQVEFFNTYKRMRDFIDAGLAIIFVSDHWKDISKSFRPSNAYRMILPEKLFVPDELAYQLQFQYLLSVGATKTQLQNSLEIFGHTGVELSLQKISQLEEDRLKILRKKYCLKQSSTIVMFLDAITISEGKKLGFNWKTALRQAVQHLASRRGNYRLLVKPHPRQSLSEVSRYIARYSDYVDVRIVEEPEPEPFIYLAEEVWGITTVLLIVALNANKKIIAFMPNRTFLGQKESNAHIEPFLFAGP